ncbi:hypothetical protein DAPPUDRAFT_236091 [Daphnia pulex]|uniref:Uncharacterized protein n=1 Tax=Daphnia pulex TaxID=6669 RepID=E9FZY0_DAPPU|nr:hypothetical protein DAPPUDRAFT_236091 [Daphnia pulex]|eukprot:EFX87179.1 hypothetical protein DAPPUDRAFT_236091 [Daphnia pulex]
MDLLSARSYAMIILLVTHAHVGPTEEKQLELQSENYVKMQEMFKEQATQLEELKIRVQQQESVINSMQRDKSIEID